MKTTLPFGLIVAAASTLLACSSEGGAPRAQAGTGPIAGAGGQTAGGSGGGAGAGSGTNTGGTSAGGAGGAGGGNGSTANLGPALVIGADGAVVDSAGSSAISGAVILSQSTQRTVIATTSHRDGALCMSGTTAAVLNGDYVNYWGAELSLDLNRVANPDAPAADAGADAGEPVLGMIAQSWPYGNVIGFSFKIEGQDTTSPTGGLPDSLRFKGLPPDTNSALNTYCNTLASGSDPPNSRLTAGATQEILFEEITFSCWTAGNSSLSDATIQKATNAGPPPVVDTTPNSRTLLTIGWQVSAQPLLEYPYDFCVTDLRPILAP
jgi:hypothetical protein